MFHLKNVLSAAGLHEADCLRALAALTEDTSSVRSLHFRWLTATYNSTQLGDPRHFSGLHGHSNVHEHTQTTQIKVKAKPLKIKKNSLVFNSNYL